MFIVYAIIVFLVLVFVHELGHFLAARAVGIRVKEFAIGMGPKIVSKQKGETLFSLRAIPFGGFCSMEGEDEESEDPKAFNNKPAHSRALVLFAGSVMNIIFAMIILMIIIFAVGEPDTKLSEVEKNSPAYNAGIAEGDRIIAIDGNAIEEWGDINNILTGIIEEKAPESETSEADASADNSKADATADNSKADATAGDSQSDASKADASKNESASEILIDIKIEREDGSVKNIETQLYKDKEGAYKIGISPEINRTPLYALKSIGYGAKATWTMTKMMYQVLGKLVTGRGNLNELTGPVGIVKAVGDSAEYGFLFVLQLAALISLNLGIVNLLPFPALDGGRIVFLVVRLFTGKRISDRFEGGFHMVGFVILIGFMIFITIRDVEKFFF